MNLKEIKDIISLMNEHNLTEFELEKDGVRIHLKKQTAISEFAQPVVVSQSVPRQAAGVSQPADGGEAVSEKKFIEIKSPMVGTFYRAPSPESPPFIEIGATIEVGQVVCIVEAMKLMNEIKAEVRGKIVDVLVDNAEPVEYGQTLFLVDPS